MKILLIFFLIICDFSSKLFIFNNIELHQIIYIFPFLDITHIHNYGISFGLFAGILPTWLIIITGIFMTIFLFFWMIKSVNNLERLGLLFIISGAISNIGDRLFSNYVIDFIFLHYKSFYWPAFNFADIYISLGIVLIIIESFKFFKTSLKENND